MIVKSKKKAFLSFGEIIRLLYILYFISILSNDGAGEDNKLLDLLIEIISSIFILSLKKQI